MSKWEHVGNCNVDAGLIWIGDPCYIIPNSRWKEWGDFCYELFKLKDPVNAVQFAHDLGHSGLGVCVSSGYGDGTYPVYVRKNGEGRIIEAKILFDEEEKIDE